MPTTEHWETYWKHLIRGCYGAELLRLKKLGKIAPSALLLPDIPDKAEPAEVKQILENFAKEITADALPLIQQIDISGDSRIARNSNLETRMLTTATGGGDVILEDNKPIYVSIVL